MRYEKINILITFEPQKEKQTPTFSSANHKVRKSQPNLPSRCTLVSIFEKILTFHFYSLFPRTAFIIKEWLKTRVKVKSCNCLSTFFYSLFTCASERYFNCFLFLLTNLNLIQHLLSSCVQTSITFFIQRSLRCKGQYTEGRGKNKEDESDQYLLRRQKNQALSFFMLTFD